MSSISTALILGSRPVPIAHSAGRASQLRFHLIIMILTTVMMKRWKKKLAGSL
ncbi:Zinc finger, C3HC4 type (RING finger) [Musa troglodytarum]|uniref:Zinc finger, C3HC4 type (RING finger) n=1 Tax=Musa troglodytarum TaxID=320322 RepID=A0A9E7HN53_9LILI|nr:Zinc finger, C3HC4 type (RING finger) [Musa troglodytarum]